MAALCLVLALVVTVALATTYVENITYQSLREKSALAVPRIQVEIAAQQRQNAPALQDRIREVFAKANLRVLLLDPDTMKVEVDTSFRNATGKTFKFDAADSDMQQMYTATGLEGGSAGRANLCSWGLRDMLGREGSVRRRRDTSSCWRSRGAGSQSLLVM